MSSPEAPATCERLVALIESLGEEAPNRVVTHTILDHLARCPTCCRAEAALTRLLADYRFADAFPLPVRLEQRLLDQVCGQFRPCDEGERL